MARIRQSPDWEAQFLAHVGAQVKTITEAVADDARAACPIDSGELVESIGTRYPGKLHGVVRVGTDHWHATEYGSPAHWIVSHGPWSLRDDDFVYYGRRVWHPGTPEQSFMRSALYRKRALSPARVRSGGGR